MKKMTTIITAFILMIGLSACAEKGLTELSLNGVSNYSVNVNREINLLEGVTLIGNDGVDYTSELTTSSFACTIDENKLYTGKTGTCDITYIAVVAGKYVKEEITITIVE